MFSARIWQRLAVAVVVVAVLVPASRPAVAQRSAQPAAELQAAHPTHAAVAQRMEALAARKAKEKWRFGIGSTEVMSFSTAALTGGEQGLPSRELLERRRNFAIAALALYEREKQRLGIKPARLDGAACRPGAQAFSWQSRGYVYPPRDQNINHAAACGSCWAFAATAAYESAFLIENGVRADVTPPAAAASEQRLLNCTPDSNCTLGFVYKTLDTLLLAGTTGRADDGYLASKLPCLPSDKIKYRTLAWGPVIPDATKVAMPSRIKEVLCAFGPVTSRIISTDSFVAFSGAVPFRQVDNVDVNTKPAHHLVIVGWDDSKGRSGSWLVKNSWGDKWGMKDDGMPGYAWVEYGANLIGHHANWVKAFHAGIGPDALGPEYAKLKQTYFAGVAAGP